MKKLLCKIFGHKFKYVDRSTQGWGIFEWRCKRCDYHQDSDFYVLSGESYSITLPIHKPNFSCEVRINQNGSVSAYYKKSSGWSEHDIKELIK